MGRSETKEELFSLRDHIRILHVDADTDFVELTADRLKQEEDCFRVETATSASEGLSRFDVQEFDCIISDYELPNQTGIEFLESIREVCPDIPFLLFTANGSEELASTAISAGVTEYLQKEAGSNKFPVIANRIGNLVEQYRSHRELEVSQQRLSLFIEQSPLGVIEWNEDFECRQMNDAAEGILGYSQDELQEHSWQKIVPESDREPVSKTVSDLLSNTGGHHSVNENVRSNGERIVCEWHNRIVTDDDGTVVAIFSQFQDVTERIERERRISELQERTNALMNTASKQATAQVAVEAAHEVLDAELSGFHLVSEDRQTLEPLAYVDTVRETLEEPPAYERTADSDPASRIIWRTFERGDSLLIEDTREYGRLAEVTPARSGIILPLDGHGVFIVTATEPNAFDTTDRALLEILTASLTTALDRVERELRLREREQQLETEHGRLRALFEMIPEPVIHTQFDDGQPLVVDVNSAFEETFGCEEQNVVGRSINDVIVPSGRLTEAEQIDEQAQSKGAVKQEVRRHTPEGLGDFLFRSIPVGNSAETNEHYGIYVDITEQKAYERELEQQNDRLDEFASVLSHDLRNPLNVAQGRIELIQKECESPHFDAVEQAHTRMETLIDDILTLAREGRTAIDLEPVSLPEMVTRCWQTVETADATLVTDIDQTIRADRSQLQQLLENLVRNAIDHGGDAVTVRVGDLNDGFYIEDDGVAIPEDEQEDVFTMGYSTANNGTGFGLSIVKQAVEAHEWDINVTDSHDGGTRFEITGVTSIE